MLAALRVNYRRKIVGAVDHAAIVEHVRGEGAFSGRYGFMIAMSCAIATLGLLLSSPAVIIGAMLISPLMGPIIMFGFSLCILDLKALRRALFALLIGVGLALAMSYGIAKVSPLTQATPEILSRTQPNLFDLLVAVFSGLAGGYAVINRKGETIVGVAIATALMPPLAVVGYGLATNAMAIAGGAFFLFMTNLLAIALSVTLLAKWYGFGAAHSPTHALWQSALIIGVFAALSAPLGLALKRISYEARVTHQARAVIQDFYRDDGSRLSYFSVGFPPDALRIDATVLTHEYKADSENAVKTALEERIERNVTLNLDQVLVDQSRGADMDEILRRAESSLAAPLQAQIAQINRRERYSTDLRSAASFKVAALDVDVAEKAAKIFAAPSDYLTLSAYREMEGELRERYSDWSLTVVPAPQALPPIYFETGADTVSAEVTEAVATILWALERWGATHVTVVGYASTAGQVNRFDNTSLAFRRANAVLSILQEAGYRGEAVGEYRAFRQSDLERNYGFRRFQRVDVRIAAPAAETPAAGEAQSPPPQ